MFRDTFDAQAPEVKLIADTVVVQAEGSNEAAPELARMTFEIPSHDKESEIVYHAAIASMQRIVALTDKAGLRKEDISDGALTLSPLSEPDSKNKAKPYSVQGQSARKVHDFPQFGPLSEGALEEGLVKSRSPAYSLPHQEAAERCAAAEPMHRAAGRAAAALLSQAESVNRACQIR